MKTYSETDLIKISQWLKVLGDPNRLCLLEKIIEGVHCNCELGHALNIAPNLISHHLSILKESGLISAERDQQDSRWINYSVNAQTLAEIQTLFDDFFDTQRIQSKKALGLTVPEGDLLLDCC